MKAIKSKNTVFESPAADFDIATSSNRNRNKRTQQFFLLAVAMDLLLFVTELAAGISPLKDIAAHPLLYGYVFIITLIVFSIFGAIVGSREDQLEKLALRDPLTGLFNSRYLWARMDEQWATGKRERTVSSLVLFDLDFFKKVNDKHGHPVGDVLLKQIGKILQRAGRQGDTVARIGGEEFVVFLPNTSATEAVAMAERIRKTISLTTITTSRQQQIRITTSAGVASTREYTNITPQALYSQADKALFQAKQQGKNKVVSSNSPKQKAHKAMEISV